MTNPPSMAMLFLLLFRILFTICVTSYTPVDNFAVKCGSSGDSLSPDHRKWIGDDTGICSPIESSKSSVSAKAQVGKPIPYSTARLSRSEFSYSFPMTTDGQKFIRLYVYPSSYDLKFLRSDSLFSVRAGSHTLLKDFNASIIADYAGEETILREFCVNVYEGESLNLIFTPNPSHPNAYAFVNGIEVVSMPNFLYYTNPDNLNVMMMNGGNQQYPIENNRALETLYRINVGGRHIPPQKDTGMFRSWDQDVQYLERERPYSASAGYGLKPIYKDDKNYFAPDELYMTARNYGENETSKFNVTWEFLVDSEFIYMVRLHFCEFDKNIQHVGDRVFQIYIADKLVEAVADVMIWSEMQILVPVRRDYAVSMQGKGSLKKLNLSIKLQPHPYARSTYRDVLLNGIEILKISDFKDNLGVPNPDPLPSMPSSKSSKNNAKKMRIISIVIGATSGFVLLSLIVLLIIRRLTRAPANEGSPWWGQSLVDSSKTNKSNGSSLQSNLCRCFSIDEIRAATNNFDDASIIGVGGFGNVYKGCIDHGLVSVAIKRLKQGSQQGLQEFQ